MRDPVSKDKVDDAAEWHPRLIPGLHTHPPTHTHHTHMCTYSLIHTCIHMQSCTHMHTHMNIHVKYISERTFSLVPKPLCILLIPRYLTWKPSPVKIQDSYFMKKFYTESTCFLREPPHVLVHVCAYLTALSAAVAGMTPEGVFLGPSFSFLSSLILLVAMVASKWIWVITWKNIFQM